MSGQQIPPQSSSPRQLLPEAGSWSLGGQRSSVAQDPCGGHQIATTNAIAKKTQKIEKSSS
jgi:hypothetical protein